MRKRIRKLTEGLRTSAGATDTSLAVLQRTLGYSLPEQYLEFQRYGNGVEGSVAESYLVIWPVEEVCSLNDMNAVKDFAPELLLFASDSGSTGYAFDTALAGMPIVQVDLILSDVRENIATSFFEFLEKLVLATNN